MTAPTRPRLRPNLIVRQVEEDIVLYDPVTDQTALLNHSAAAILELCDGIRSTDEIVIEIAALYLTDPEPIAAQVDVTLAEFARHGLVDIEDTPPA